MKADCVGKERVFKKWVLFCLIFICFIECIVILNCIEKIKVWQEENGWQLFLKDYSDSERTQELLWEFAQKYGEKGEEEYYNLTKEQVEKFGTKLFACTEPIFTMEQRRAVKGAIARWKSKEDVSRELVQYGRVGENWTRYFDVEKEVDREGNGMRIIKTVTGEWWQVELFFTQVENINSMWEDKNIQHWEEVMKALGCELDEENKAYIRDEIKEAIKNGKSVNLTNHVIDFSIIGDDSGHWRIGIFPSEE